jgi:TPR repeat protein
MYANGLGVRQDYAEAWIWYRRAADQGDAEAQYSLGAMYAKGKGVPQDYAEAAIWYRKAADQGVPTAQGPLGLMYAKGQGVPQDLVEAHKWSNLAVAGFRASDVAGRDTAVKLRNQIENKMTPAQIAEAQRLALEWRPR